MFAVDCDAHQSGRVLLDLDNIVAMRSTERGVEIDWLCWCGNVGTWHPNGATAAAPSELCA